MPKQRRHASGSELFLAARRTNLQMAHLLLGDYAIYLCLYPAYGLKYTPFPPDPDDVESAFTAFKTQYGKGKIRENPMLKLQYDAPLTKVGWREYFDEKKGAFRETKWIQAAANELEENLLQMFDFSKVSMFWQFCEWCFGMTDLLEGCARVPIDWLSVHSTKERTTIEQIGWMADSLLARSYELIGYWMKKREKKQNAGAIVRIKKRENRTAQVEKEIKQRGPQNKKDWRELREWVQKGFDVTERTAFSYMKAAKTRKL